MKVLKSINEFVAKDGFLAVTIGNFDGVHLGHQKLIKVAVEQAVKRQGHSLVFTFEPHPLAVLSKQPIKLLQQQEEKRQAIAELGVDYLLELPFTSELAALSPQAFFEKYLVQGLRPSWLTVGYNFSFGENGSGNAELLQTLGAEYGIKTQIEPAFLDKTGKPISSSRIRQLVSEGKIQQANHLLGREYQLNGKIVQGCQLGRQLGFPTANILAEPYMLLPAFGVYAALAVCKKTGEQADKAAMMPAVVNVGLRPTVAENVVPTIETHCLGISQDFYGKNMQVCFVQEIRAEQRFASFDLLIKQIAVDSYVATKILQEYQK